jgi:hypothetical protein
MTLKFVTSFTLLLALTLFSACSSSSGTVLEEEIPEESCETQGMDTLEDGSCVEVEETPKLTCEERGLITGDDGNCTEAVVVEPTCEERGLITGDDGNCTEAVATESTCEERGLITADDGTCIESTPEPTCEERGLITGDDGNCTTCENLGQITTEDGSCITEQERCELLLEGIWSGESCDVLSDEEKCSLDGKVWNGSTCIEIKSLKSLYISGVAVDGYVKGGNARLFETNSSEAIKSFTTGAKGGWEFEFILDEDNNSLPENFFVTVVEGTDISTGEAFEGKLSRAISLSDFQITVFQEDPLSENRGRPDVEFSEPLAITPITTIVVSTLESDDSIDVAEAEKRVAKSFGISEKSVKSDPIATLDDENADEEDRENAAIAIKQALLIQKVAESLSKSVVNEENTSDGSTDLNSSEEDVTFEDVFSAVLTSVAKKIKESSENSDSTEGETLDFEKVLEEESDSFTEEITTNIQTKIDTKTESAKRPTRDLRAKMLAFAKMLVRLRAASRVTRKVVVLIKKINTKSISIKTESGVDQFEVVSKATEIVTTTLETKIKEIAKIEVNVSDEVVDALVEAQESGESDENISKITENIKSEELDNSVKNAEKVVNAVIAMGGIETVAKKVEKVVEKAEATKKAEEEREEFDAENSEVEASIDINQIDILDENTTEQYSKIYDQFEEIGVSENAMIEATIEYNQKVEEAEAEANISGEVVTPTVSIVDLVVEKERQIAEDEGKEEPVIDTEKVAEVKESVETQVAEAKKVLDTKSEEILAKEDLIKVEVVQKIVPKVSILGSTTGYTKTDLTFSSSITNRAELDGKTVFLSWSVNGETAGTGSSISQNFSAVGTYSIVVTATADGLSSSASLNIKVVNKPLTCEERGLITGEDGTTCTVPEPEVTEPEVTEPEVTEPEVTEPEVTEPEVTEPEVTEPEVTEPEVTEPEVTEPEVTEPEVTETCEEQGMVTADDGSCFTPETPTVSLASSQTTAYTGTTITFTASSSVENTIYGWSVNSVQQSETAGSFSKSFSSAGTYTVKVTGTAYGLTGSASKSVTIRSRDTSDILGIKSNKIIFGSGEFEKSTVTEDGEFSTIKYEPLASVSEENRSAVLSISLDLENVNFEGGETETVTIAMKVEDNSSDRAIMSITPDIKLSYSSGKFSINTAEATTLYGYGVRDDGTALSTQLDNIDFSSNISIVSNRLTFDYAPLIETIEESEVGTSSTLIDNYFTKGGTYRVSIFVSGLDGFNGMKTVSTAEATESFFGDNSYAIDSKLSDTNTFGITGLIDIADIGEI